MPISRRMLKESINDDYGAAMSLLLRIAEAEVSVDQIVVYDLADQENGDWAHQSQDNIAIDPVVGRMAFPEGQELPLDVHVTFH